jgi:hypothetical protein
MFPCLTFSSDGLFALLGLRGRHEDVHTLSTYGAAGTRNNMGESPLYTYLSTS